jgi:hypothetical protein
MLLREHPLMSYRGNRGAEYLGALLLSDPAFCREICRMLIQYCGKTIREIGDINLGHTF